ncbi:porin family protein [Neiella sp. HB171785]|uniref:Porin family protein n=1 Tax=Neiella litorisoli TaxID=2771431 RepID=A0A8J6UMZ1_9GAMM|nr:porin family protein [Neiella litorisoli]MBD1391260.1 porin family protein [Neiella litorisoli]
MKFIAVATLTSVLLTPAFALANEETTSNSNFYAGANISAITLDLGPSDVDFGVAGVSLGYQFNDYFAVEGRLGTGFSDDDIEQFELSVNHQYGAYLKAAYPFDNVVPYLIVGYTEVELEAEFEKMSATDTEQDTSYGVGVAGNFDGWNMYIDYMNYIDKNSVEYSGWTVGFNVTF